MSGILLDLPYSCYLWCLSLCHLKVRPHFVNLILHLEKLKFGEETGKAGRNNPCPSWLD